MKQCEPIKVTVPHNIGSISLQDCDSDHQDSDHIPMQGLVAHDKHTAPVEHTTSYLILCTRELFFNFFNALSLENFVYIKGNGNDGGCT